ncbi:carbohydrate kinase family protein [Sinorhizobium medicae]|uniref:Carbohydrate kinase family protein n=1 Tax=Sinorhizobium medicae TaxID=110321 RepID=A0A6G1WHZ4_9HYPH|nr:carbohydrate kinase family protein [Sinorhizobium medicae]MBO1942620.1 carbohydrate kinase family protein [Sinorhizobium medicae]MDX0403421.1 carbohydrate kinase family protein [Sinorhizobium medicae]MDX0409573.1 carbohydrate kinase family protein [Sinorhizobium medicae]MDX0415690.1 carbohydrate kinase family protein [Sinorhizobium medicae]MDX0421672.1 carbohydrate kinase family protein [Sinorhizobium medicae]
MSGGRRGILTGGTWCADYNRTVSHWPGEDGLAELFEEERHGGGSGCNLALDIKHLDPAIPVETIGLVGDDDDGRYLRATAAAAGIDTSQMMVTAAAATQFCDAYVSLSSHRRTHIFHAGSGALLTPDHFDFSSTRMRYLHLGLPGVHRILDAPWHDEANGWVVVLKKARAAGLETNLELASVDRALMARLVAPCLPHLDFLIVNDLEIGAIAGVETIVRDAPDQAACMRAARAVLERGALKLVAVHCPAFAIAVTRWGEGVVLPSVAIPKQEIKGANGAGDAFAAGMLYGIHEGWSVGQSLRLAHATAAASLRSISTTGAVLPWRDCLALADKWDSRDY